MAVDASTPVPDELDARVEQMLQQIDRVHAEVVNRLDLRTDEDPAPSETGLEVGIQRALRDAAEAAGRANQAAEAAPESTPARPTGEDVPTATIKDLDEQLAGAVSAAAVDDEFADGASLVEGQSLDVPLPPSSPLGDLPEIATPAIAAAPVAPTMEPLAPRPAPVAGPAPAPAPAPPARPTSAPAPAPAPAPAAKPIAPAVIAPPKPAGPTLTDRFWVVATPVVEPVAVRLGKLPVGFQHTVGWVGIVTLFMAAATWGYVLFFQETRPMSHILEEQMAAQSGAHAEKGRSGPLAEGAAAADAERAGDAPPAGKGSAPNPPKAEKRGEHAAPGAESGSH